MTSRNAFGELNYCYHPCLSHISGINRQSIPAYQRTKSYSVSDRENNYK